MITGESSKASRILNQHEEEMGDIEQDDNRICIEEHQV